MRALLLSVLCGGLVLAPLPAAAQAAPAGACTIAEARAHKADAYRAYVRAAKRYREECRRLAAQKRYAELYGSAVARWTRLGRRVGYTWTELPTLMRVIDRESGGDPQIPNSAGSGALGLMQVMPEWADGSKGWYWDRWGLPALWDRTHAPATLSHTVHMDWSQWGE